MTEELNAITIACSLTPEELHSRKSLARESLVPHIVATEKCTNGLKITFQDTPAVRSNVEMFAALEQQCCGFLSLTVTPRAEGLALIIEGPAEAQELIDMFLAEISAK